MRITIGNRAVEYRVFKYHWRVGNYSGSGLYGFSIVFWATIPESEKDEELESVRRAITTNPQNAMNYFLLGNTFRRAGLLTDARSAYETAAKTEDGSQWPATAQRYLREIDEQGWKDAGPSITWRANKHFVFAPFHVKKRP